MANNVIFLSLDDLNSLATMRALAPELNLTPNIDRLTNVGTTFTNAFSQIALCNPSRTSILAGQNPAVTGVHDNASEWYEKVDPTETLQHVLKTAGFNTATTGKIFHTLPDEFNRQINSTPLSTSTDLWNTDADNGEPFGQFNIGPIPDANLLDMADDQDRPALASLEGHGDTINTRAAIKFLNETRSQAEGGDPFMLSLGLFRPHGPWGVSDDYFSQFPIQDIVLPDHVLAWLNAGDFTTLPDFVQNFVDGGLSSLIPVGTPEAEQPAAIEAALKTIIQGYLASIKFADDLVGELLDALKASDHANNTSIVLWSDHGYHLGDKDQFHKFTLWDQATRAPLIVATAEDVANLDTEQGAAQTIDNIVELVDIFPTVLDLAGVTAPAAITDKLSGQSLIDFVNGSTPQGYVDQAITTMYGSVSIRTPEYRYTLYENGEEELYQYSTDQNEINNLGEDPNFAQVRSELKSTLIQSLAQDGWIIAEPDTTEVAGDDSGNTYVLQGQGQTVEAGTGDDIYFIGRSGNVDVNGQPISVTAPVITDAGGNDRVFTSINYTLGQGIENLNGKSGYGALVLTGNDLNNDIVGSAIADTLAGLAGNDTLDGQNGDDSVDGGDGNDALFGRAGNDTLNGRNGDDVLSPGTGNDSVDGGDGTDTITYSDSSVGVSVNLAIVGPQVVTSTKSDTISSIENIVGSNLNDRLTGNTQNNLLAGAGGSDRLTGGDGDDRFDGGTASDTLDGGNGNDILLGGDGSDTIIGGDGVDTISYENSVNSPNQPGGVTFDLNITVAQSTRRSGSEEIVTGVENILGSALNDTLSGNGADNRIAGGNGNDTIRSAAGNDVLEGGLGTDTLDGGDGTDTVDYQFTQSAGVYQQAIAATLGAIVTLSTAGAQSSGDVNSNAAFGDTLISIENLSGTNQRDILTGSLGNNVLIGRNGDDTLNGLEGNDHLDGGEGNDRLDGGEGNDVLLGGAGNDILGGGNNNDTLYGDAGNDAINGGGSNDTLIGGLGADALNGGDGNDTVDYRELALGILDTGGVIANLAASSANSGAAAGDTYVSIEFLSGTDHDDLLTGDAFGNRLTGNGGNDTLDGGIGSDTLFGGAGNDTLLGGNNVDILDGDVGHDALDGGSDNDSLTGGAGNDTLNGGSGRDTAHYTGAVGNFSFARIGSDIVITDNTGAEGSDRLSSVEVLLLAGVSYNVNDLIPLTSVSGTVFDFGQSYQVA